MIKLTLKDGSVREIESAASAAEIIKGNCTDWVFLTSKELPLLNEISELCGFRRGRALISPSELQRLKKGNSQRYCCMVWYFILI